MRLWLHTCTSHTLTSTTAATPAAAPPRMIPTSPSPPPPPPPPPQQHLLVLPREGASPSVFNSTPHLKNTARMKVVVPFIALLLAGLGPVCAMADDEAAAAAAPSKEMKAPPMRLRPHDKRPGRGPVVTAPMVGGKEDVTGSNNEQLSDVSKVRAELFKRFSTQIKQNFMVYCTRPT